MFSQDDDSQQRVALFLVFCLVAIVVASVLAFGATHRHALTRYAAGPDTALASAAKSAVLPAASGAALAAADAASVKVEQDVVKFYFASGKADLAAGAGEALLDLVKGAQTGRTVAISGFHDATGGASQNAELARQRALAVRDALMTAGLLTSQIMLNKPEQIVSTDSDAQARRVEITLQ